jgi:hypothetical protein
VPPAPVPRPLEVGGRKSLTGGRKSHTKHKTCTGHLPVIYLLIIQRLTLSTSFLSLIMTTNIQKVIVKSHSSNLSSHYSISALTVMPADIQKVIVRSHEGFIIRGSRTALIISPTVSFYVRLRQGHSHFVIRKC